MPYVGLIVHYIAYGTPGGEFPAGVRRAAVITEVCNSSQVRVAVLNPEGLFFSKPLFRGDAPGMWNFIDVSQNYP